MIHLLSAVCSSNDCVTDKDVRDTVEINDEERIKSWVELGWNNNCKMEPSVLFFIGISKMFSKFGSLESPVLGLIDVTKTFLLESEKHRYLPLLLQVICSMLRKPLEIWRLTSFPR